jgi:hypothetical protein
MKTIKETNKYSVCENGFVYSMDYRGSGKIQAVKPALDLKGYQRVGLIIEGKLVTRKVHRLVAETFIPNPEKKAFVNHKDGNKLNNSVFNLEWVTAKENTKHAIDNGLFSFQNSEKSVNKNPKKGELNGQSVLTEKQVIEIRSKYKPKIYGRKMLAMEYNVSQHTIKDIVTKRSWRHI